MKGYGNAGPAREGLRHRGTGLEEGYGTEGVFNYARNKKGSGSEGQGKGLLPEVPEK